MSKAQRTPERVFSAVMWVVSVVFAMFLGGFAGLLIQDLPRAAEPVAIEKFYDPVEAVRVERALEAARVDRADLDRRIETADLVLSSARNAYQAERDAYDNWIAARTATTDPAQDPEVLARTRRLDELKASERTAEIAREALDKEDVAVREAESAAASAETAMMEAARPAFERAAFVQELRIFGWRLMLTLPLLAISVYLVMRQRANRYWPLMRGFVIFSAWTFFVELVPYLPDYGGYVRFGVGILLTVLASHYVIKWMRRYLASREAVETQAETERRGAIKYEEALKKIAAKTCPSCDRGVVTTGETDPDYCVHCGLRLFDRCTHCNTRKFAFFRYCMSCGNAVEPKAAATP